MGAFVKVGDIRQERFDWGIIGWRIIPSHGARHLVVLDVELDPGQGHDFHRHPGQEEIIIVKRGTIKQYLGKESTSLGPGDSVLIPEGLVHASFNDSDDTAHLQVVLSPSLGGDTGYELDDVAHEEPWASMRNR